MVESAGRGSTLRQAQGSPTARNLYTCRVFVLGFISFFGIVPKSVIYFQCKTHKKNFYLIAHALYQ